MSEEEKFVKSPANPEKPSIIQPLKELKEKVTGRLNKETLEKIYDFANRIIKLRGKPLLVIFYPETSGTSMLEEDAIDIRKEFESSNLIWNEKEIEELDVIIHTFGGMPSAAYLMIQAIYDFAKKLNILVPYFSYSAGTLFSMGGHQIRLGGQAVLSPIDIHAEVRKNEIKQRIELISIDYFIQFVSTCRKRIEEALEKFQEDSNTERKISTKIEESLLNKLVEQEGAINLGQVFRARTLTGHYAEKLLLDYMLKSDPDKIEKMNTIIATLLFKCPSHDFIIDFHLAKDMELVVDEMEPQESELTKELIDYLRKKGDIICKYKGEKAYFPFIKLFR